MKINPIKNINFSSTERCVYKNEVTNEISTKDYYNTTSKYNQMQYSNYTVFFREDLMTRDKTWDDFTQTINDFFKDAPKVNIYDFGASDGSEAYSLILSLVEKFGYDKAKKYFPIKAYDIDEYVIQKAKNGKINMDDCDIRAINKNAPITFSKYFSFYKDPYEIIYNYCLCPSEDIKKAVEFNVGNFLDELDNIEPQNCLIMCRNFWNYLTVEQRKTALKKLGQKIDTTSLVVIGEYDKNSLDIDNDLNFLGFEEISNNVFKRINP